MRRFWTIVLSIVAWVALIAYLVWALDVTHRGRNSTPVRTLSAQVVDSTRQSVVSSADLREWIGQTGIELRNADVNEINTETIRRAIAAKPFIKDVVTYTTSEGRIAVKVWQRYPVCRIMLADGNDFFVTDDNYIIPSDGTQPLYLPLVTGAFTPPFKAGYTGELKTSEKKLDKNYTFLSKLINFVKFIENDPFWRDQIVQINVGSQSAEDAATEWKEPQIEIVPRVGDFSIIFGELENVEQKFEKLMLMYDNVIGFEGWGGYKVINLRYDNQVVCSN